MKKRIFNFEQNGETVTGFDTGLSAQAFAQAKIPQFITRPGYIVYPEGKVEEWQPGGVVEQNTMVVWGPLFPGERLDSIIIDKDRKDEALNHLCNWLKAVMIMDEKYSGDDLPYPGPAGALAITGRQQTRSIFPVGTILFPPARLIKRSIEAEGDETALNASRWVHPDLKGPEAISFCTGTMLYSIFCGINPYPGDNRDILSQDIREGVFIPLNLASPGLDQKLADFITSAIGSNPQNKGTRPSPKAIYDTISPSAARHVSSWLRPVTDEDNSRIRTEIEQYSKKKALTVKTKRFMVRNTTILMVCMIAMIAAALIVRGEITRRAEMPNTRGMTPQEIAAAYYGSFGELDHSFMDACVTGRAGKGDIEMVINFFVISRMRQAYEMYMETILSAQEWFDAGCPPTEKTIFGVTDLKTGNLVTVGDTVILDVDYILWMPGSYVRENDDDIFAVPENDEFIFIPPVGTATRDRLTFVMRKDAWLISSIVREIR